MAAIVLEAASPKNIQGHHRKLPAKDAYYDKVLELGGDGEECSAEYDVDIPKAGSYQIRVACNNGHALHGFELTVDGTTATREAVAFLDMDLGITRKPYSTLDLTWIPGWKATLSQGAHKITLRRTAGRDTPGLILDAIAIQPEKDLRLTQ